MSPSTGNRDKSSSTRKIFVATKGASQARVAAPLEVAPGMDVNKSQSRASRTDSAEPRMGTYSIYIYIYIYERFYIVYAKSH